MNWLDYFKQLTISLIAIPVVVAGVVYLAKLIFDRWFKAREQDYQHRLQLSENEHKHDLELMRESHIETLRQISKKEEIRFSGLNQLQLKGIEKLYDELLELYWRATEYLPGSNERAEQGEAFTKQLRLAWTIAHKTKIYFPKSQAKKIIDFIDELNKMGMERAIIREKHQSQNMQEVVSALEDTKDMWQRLIKEIPKMLETVEDECRALLNVENINKDSSQ